jgi:hypothetical protein
MNIKQNLYVYRSPENSLHGADCLISQQLLSCSRIPQHLWNPKVYFCVHKSCPLVPIVSQINPVHATPHCSHKVRFNISPPTLRSSWWSFSFRFFHQSPVCIDHLPHALPIYLIFDFIILIIFDKEYKLWSSAWNFLQLPIISSLTEQSSVIEKWWRSLLNENMMQTNSAETSNTQEKKFELRSGAEAEWQHDCPHWMFEDMAPVF